MEIKKIDDLIFRERLVSAFRSKDSPRRFEIHFTDLINCIFCSFKRKVLPENDGVATDEEYQNLLRWGRGLAFDWTITSRISGKIETWIEGAQGNVDMMLEGIPYELTSTPFLSRAVKESNNLDGRFQYKLSQLRFYMAGLGVKTGRLKIIEMLGGCRKKHEHGPKICEGPGPLEHTWRIKMTPLELAEARIELIARKNVLVQALASGHFQNIPRSMKPIVPDSRCVSPDAQMLKPICHEYIKAIPRTREIEKAWKTWITLAMDEEQDNFGPLQRELRRWM